MLAMRQVTSPAQEGGREIPGAGGEKGLSAMDGSMRWCGIVVKGEGKRRGGEGGDSTDSSRVDSRVKKIKERIRPSPPSPL